MPPDCAGVCIERVILSIGVFSLNDRCNFLDGITEPFGPAALKITSKGVLTPWYEPEKLPTAA